MFRKKTKYKQLNNNELFRIKSRPQKVQPPLQVNNECQVFRLVIQKKILSIQPSLRTDHQGFRSGIGRIPDPTQFLTVKKRVLKGNSASFYGRLMIKKTKYQICLPVLKFGIRIHQMKSRIRIHSILHGSASLLACWFIKNIM